MAALGFCGCGKGLAATSRPASSRPATRPAGEEVTVLSLNVLKPIWQKPGQPSWNIRREKVFELLKELKPGFFCTQEEADRQVQDILQADSAYKEVGHRGQSGAIFYRHERWQLLEAGRCDFPKWPRYFLWARFKDKATGKRIDVYTTHVPFLGQMTAAARMNAVGMIARHIADRKEPQTPVVLTGDFNSTPDTPPMRYLTGEAAGSPVKLIYAHKDVPVPSGPKQSMGIDHILTLPGMKVIDSGVARGIWESGSDHPAVYAVLRW